MKSHFFLRSEYRTWHYNLVPIKPKITKINPGLLDYILQRFT